MEPAVRRGHSGVQPGSNDLVRSPRSLRVGTNGRLRSLTLSIAGATAGVLGLTNAQGFGFYAASVVLVNVLILVVNARMQPSDYFILGGPTSTDPAEELAAANAAKERAPKTLIESAWELGKFIVLQGAQDNLLSFILWWTFFYAIVHGAWLRGAERCANVPVYD